MRDSPALAKAIDGALVLAAFSAALYIASSAHYGGLLSTFNLDPNLLERDLYLSLYGGLLALLSTIIGVSLLAGIIAAALALLFIPELSKLVRQRMQSSKALDDHLAARELALGRPLMRFTQLASEKTALWMLPISFSALLLVLLLVGVERDGRKSGDAILKKIEEDALVVRDIMIVELGGTQRSLVHLACGSNYCAGIDPCSRQVFYYPQGPRSFIHSDAPAHQNCKPSIPSE